MLLTTIVNIVGYPLWQHYSMKYDVTRANNRYLVNVNCNSATHKNSKLKSCTAHDCRLLRITWYFSFVKMRINAQNTVYHFYSEMDFILWDNKTKGCNEVCLIFFFLFLEMISYYICMPIAIWRNGRRKWQQLGDSCSIFSTFYIQSKPNGFSTFSFSLSVCFIFNYAR